MRYLIIIIFTITFINNIYSGTRFFRASYRDDPATTIVISWADNGTSTNARIYYGTTDHGTNYNLYPNNHGIDRTENHRGMNNRFARLTGLTPNTIYYFVVKDDEGLSSRMSFRTLSDDPNVPILFISGGDTRTGVLFIEFEADKCRERRQRGNRLVANIRPDFVAFSGDYVFSGLVNSQWVDWFADWDLTIGEEGRLTPVLPVFGNHELSEDIYKFFDIPNSNAYFALTFGGSLIRIYQLNSEIECNSSQLNWLTNDLQLHTNTSAEPYWKAVQYHIPLVPHGEYSPMNSLISCWAPLFHQYKVRLALEGHTHIQKVTWPVIPSNAAGSDNGFIRDDINGCVFAGEGCWGAPLRNLYTYHSPDAAFNWTRNQGKFTGFFLIKVTKQKIELQTVMFHNASDVANVGQVQPHDLPGTLPSGLKYWTPSNGQVVEILSNNPFSNDASLLNLNTSIGTLIPNFNATIFNYEVVLPFGTSQVPVVSATTNHINASLQITQAQNLTGNEVERTASVLVTAEDGITTNTYKVIFSTSAQSNAYLANLSSSEGVLNPAFNKEVYSYNVVLPYGTTAIPYITAIPEDTEAIVEIIQPTSLEGLAEAKVISADETNENTYTVNFSLSAGSSKEILSFTIPGQVGTTIIDNQNFKVNVNMPVGTDLTNLSPTISISGISINPASGIAQDFSAPIFYTVTAADLSTAIYEITVNVTNVNNNAFLSFLAVNPGSLTPDFEQNISSYIVNLTESVEMVEITATTSDPSATKRIFLPTNLNGNTAQRTAIVIVTASDNVTSLTYSILFNNFNSVLINNLSNQLITAYPNPTTDIIYLKTKHKVISGNIEIYNGVGYLISKYEIQSNDNFSIDLSNYPIGAYYIYIKANNEVMHIKALKK